MHWVIQQSIFKPDNYRQLVEALERLAIDYTSVIIPAGTVDIVPDVNPSGRVYVCGAIKLKRIAEERGWNPGSFLNDDFRFDQWVDALGDELLNCDMVVGQLCDIDVSHFTTFFIRPLEDNKAFDGMVIDKPMLDVWRKDPSKQSLAQLDVVVSAVKRIYREYRLFVVKNKVITGSVYKISGRPQISNDIEQNVIDYVYRIIKQWVPVESFVIDVCLTDQGYKVVEFNNINSSGFYACNVPKYVEAIEVAYG